MKKKILILGAVFILIIAAAAIYLFTNLDSIVKAAIEKYGSQAVKTAVRVSTVKIKLAHGEGALRGLSVADPPGFSFPSIMTLENIAVRIDVKSVTQTPVVIEYILVTGPEVFYEMKEDRTANVDVLKKNLAAGPAKEEKPHKGRDGKEIRLRIRKLVIEKGKVHVLAPKVAEKPYTLELPRLEMTDIGKQSGATPDEIAHTVAGALAEEAAKTVARSGGTLLLRKGAEDYLRKHFSK